MEFTKEEITNEVWKDVPEYEELYQVSDLGRVKSIRTYITRSNGVREKRQPKILKPQNNGKGYLWVQLYNNNKQSEKVYVHRLVMSSFAGHKNMPVDHMDRNRSNNRLDNLRYLSARENTYREHTRVSKYPGVSPENSKWRAGIILNGVKYYLGCFDTEFKAYKTYSNALSDWNSHSKTPDGKVKSKKKDKLFDKGIRSHSGRSKKVIDTKTGKIYGSCKDASKDFNKSYKYLSQMLSGGRPNHTSFRYLENNAVD